LTIAKRSLRTAQMRLVFITPMVVARLCTLAIAGDVENRTGTGTIVVFNASKDQIVVAADSRTTFLVNGKFVNDDKRCKITTLGHKIVFAVSGIDAIGGATVVRQGEYKWEASSIARDQYASLEKTERPVDLGDLSTRWGDAMIKKMTTHSVLNPRILELIPTLRSPRDCSPRSIIPDIFV
jgi:hypothetical protein